MAKSKERFGDISISSAAHEKISAYCESVGVSKRDLLEKLINQFLDREDKKQ